MAEYQQMPRKELTRIIDERIACGAADPSKPGKIEQLVHEDEKVAESILHLFPEHDVIAEAFDRRRLISVCAGYAKDAKRFPCPEQRIRANGVYVASTPEERATLAKLLQEEVLTTSHSYCPGCVEKTYSPKVTQVVLKHQ